MNIQVAASSELQQKIVRNALARMGYEDVTSCTTGRNVLSSLDKQVADLIITDEVLTDHSGLELTTLIRKQERGNYTPVIMMGEDFTREEVIVAINAGVNQILLKPILPERLQAKVNAVRNIRRRPALGYTRSRGCSG